MFYDLANYLVHFRFVKKWKKKLWEIFDYLLFLYLSFIGFTLLYFKMDVMPLVPETKMADVSILIILARGTTWLVLKTTSATSIFSRAFGAYFMTRISINTLIFPHTLFQNFTWSVNTALFHIFTYRVNTLFPVWFPERILSLSPFQLTESTHSSSFFTFDLQQSTALCNHSLPCYTFSVRLFPASNTEISSNHGKKQTVEILCQHA